MPISTSKKTPELDPKRTLCVPPMHGIVVETSALTRPPVVNDVVVMGLQSGVAVLLSANKVNHFVAHFDGDPAAAERALASLAIISLIVAISLTDNSLVFVISVFTSNIL